MSRISSRRPSYNTIAPLDADMDDSVSFIVTKNNVSQAFTIDKKIAKQCLTLKTVIENDTEETVYPVNGIHPELFQLIIDYLSHSELGKSQWTRDVLPDLLYTANYLNIDSLIRDLLIRICHEIDSASEKEIHVWFEKISVLDLIHPLLYCTHDHSTQHWKYQKEALNRRNELKEKCHLVPNFKLNALKKIRNPQLACLKILKMNRLYLLIPSQFRIHYDALEPFHSVLNLIQKMELKVNLHELCQKIHLMSVNELESFFSQLTVPEFKNALLYCVNVEMLEEWSLKDACLEKRKELQSRCIVLKEIQYLGLHNMELLYSENAKPECLTYMMENNVHLVLSSDFTLNYNNLDIFASSAHLLKNSNFKISLYLYPLTNVPLLIQSLGIIQGVSYLYIYHSKQFIDLSLFPNMHKLETLEIRDCFLLNVSEFLQKEFPELINLDLSYNGLSEIGMIQSMPKLQFLQLSNNRLRNVSHLLKSHLPNVRKLNLMKNPIESLTCPELMPKLNLLKWDRKSENLQQERPKKCLKFLIDF